MEASQLTTLSRHILSVEQLNGTCIDWVSVALKTSSGLIRVLRSRLYVSEKREKPFREQHRRFLSFKCLFLERFILKLTIYWQFFFFTCPYKYNHVICGYQLNWLISCEHVQLSTETGEKRDDSLLSHSHHERCCSPTQAGSCWMTHDESGQKLAREVFQYVLKYSNKNYLCKITFQ